MLLIPTSNVDLHNRSPQQKAQKSSAASIPSRRVFTSCCVVASRRTRFVCLFVHSFVPLVGCCAVSLPLVVASRPVSSPHHVVALRLVSRCPSRRRCVFASSRRRVVASLRRRVVALLRRCVSSRLVVVSRPLTHLVTPALFDCCVYCRHHAAAASVAVTVLPPPCRAMLLPPPPRRCALSRSRSRSCRSSGSIRRRHRDST